MDANTNTNTPIDTSGDLAAANGAANGRNGRNGRPNGRMAAVERAATERPVTPPDIPLPPVLSEAPVFIWNEDAPAADNYIALGKRLATIGTLYRNPQHGAGLLLVNSAAAVPPRPIVKGSQLAPVLVDHVLISVIKNGKPAGSMPSATHLNTMLHAEVFLQAFLPLDEFTTIPLYLPNFELTQPGYNDGGPGHRIYYAGPKAEIAAGMDAINRFLNVMAFATKADRTNAVAGALTVMLRNHCPGAKPLLAVTATKSHAGKETIIDFATGRTPRASVSYERQDWALQKNIAALVDANPQLRVINIENVRMDGKDKVIKSGFLERFLTDPAPVIFNTGTGDPIPCTNDFVLAISANLGKISTDLMNRALTIHLDPVGDVADRQSPIGNPRLEYLPAQRDQIEAELRGMIERWKAAGRPLDMSAKHPFTEWAQIVGGILQVSGFKDFLGNYSYRRTEDDPQRHALGLLGAAKPDDWLPTSDWEGMVGDLGLTKQLIPEADRDTVAGRQRGLGVVLSAHRDETFEIETDDEKVTLELNKARRRFDGQTPSTRYRFEILKREPIPEDDAQP